MQYGVGRSSVKAWKYLLWFFVNSCIVNAYILYTKTSRQRTKKNYSHIDFRLEVAHGLIAGFHARKHKSLSPQDVGLVAQGQPHANTYMGAKRAKKCKWHLMHKDVMPRKETRYGRKLCNVHLCKDGCHYAYHQWVQQQ